MLKKIKRFNQNLKKYYKEKSNKKVVIFYLVIRFFVLLCLVRELLLSNYHNVFLCLLTLVLLLIPYFVDDKLKIKMPGVLEVIILIFIFSSEILGEIQNFYKIFPNWDTLLHTLNGFLAAAIGFSLIDILNTTEMFHIKMSPIFVALVSFCFSMTVGIMWEFFEFANDNFLNTDMQKDTIVSKISSVNLNGAKNYTPVVIKNIDKTIIYYNNGDKEVINNGYLELGIIDTMEDLFVNFIGAIIFSVLGYFYIISRDKYKGIEHFIPKRKKV